MTTLTRKRAYGAIRVVAQAMLAGEEALSYAELSRRLGMPNETGQGLGPILDEAAAMCVERRLPDISAVIVTKESLKKGTPMPSGDSFRDGAWPISGLTQAEIPAEQERVRRFDWTSVRELNLAAT